MAKLTISIDKKELIESKDKNLEAILYNKVKDLVESEAGEDTFYYCDLLINSYIEMITTEDTRYVYEVDIEFKAIEDKTKEFANLLGRITVGI